MKLVLLFAAGALAAQDTTPPVLTLSLADTPLSGHDSRFAYVGEEHTEGTWYGDFAGDNPKARRCQAKKQNGDSCPEPECNAWDWHDKQHAGDFGSGDQLACRKEYMLVNSDNAAEFAPVAGEALNYNLRSEWLITYSATDRAGNEASQASFTMIMDDRVKPGQGTCADGNACLFQVPFSTDAGNPDQVESARKVDGEYQRWAEIAWHHERLDDKAGHLVGADSTAPNTIKVHDGAGGHRRPNFLYVEDNYDGTNVQDTLQITVETPGKDQQPCVSVDNEDAAGGAPETWYNHHCADGGTGTIVGAHCSATTTAYSHDAPVNTLDSVRIDTLCLGDYTITYRVHDFAGMYGEGGDDNSNEVVTHIQVVDTTSPTIEVHGDGAPDTTPYVHECTAVFDDADLGGATCWDSRDSYDKTADSHDDAGRLTNRPVVHAMTQDYPHNKENGQFVLSTGMGALDGAGVGDAPNTLNVIKYSCIDEQGLRATGIRQIEVRDTTPPELKITTVGDDQLDRYCDPTTGCGLHRDQLHDTCVGLADADACNAPQRHFCVAEGAEQLVDNAVPCGKDTVVVAHPRCLWLDEACGANPVFADDKKAAIDLAMTAEGQADISHYVIEHTAGYTKDMEFIALLEQDQVGYECTDQCGTWRDADGQTCTPKYHADRVEGESDTRDGCVWQAPYTETATTWHQGCECEDCAGEGGAFHTDIVGVYVLKYDCNDAHGHHTVRCRTVRNEDKFKPVLSILGLDEMTLEATTDGNYVDDGATCSDVVDGDIPANVEVSGDVVKLANIGEYIVQYNCRDQAGNQAEPMQRKVVVKQSWGAVTAKVDMPFSGQNSSPRNITLQDMESEERQLALRIAGAHVVGLHEASVKLEVYEWVGDDASGQCTLRLGGALTSARRRLDEAPTTNRQGAVGVKLIFAVPEPRPEGCATDPAVACEENKPEQVSAAIRGGDFSHQLWLKSNEALEEIRAAQSAACGSVTDETLCTEYKAASCAWDGGASPSCGISAAAVEATSRFWDDFDPCNRVVNALECTAVNENGCFYPEYTDLGDLTDDGSLLPIGGPPGTCAWTDGQCGHETIPECQNSITCTTDGQNPVTWEAGEPYADAGVSCSDTLDGVLDANQITTDAAAVDVTKTGMYLITYEAVNNAGTWNYGFDRDQCAFTRTVFVVDTLKPVISLTLGGETVGRSSGLGNKGAWVKPAGHHLNAADPRGPHPDYTAGQEIHLNPAHEHVFMAQVAAAAPSAGWAAAAAAAAVAGLALLAVSARKQDAVLTSVPV